MDGNETFDFIVVGAGSAGCVVAARLSECGQYSVLLLEAGPSDTNPWIHIPLGYTKTYFNPSINWKFESQPVPELDGRSLYVPRGKTLGGTSSINGMIYIRGQQQDYDEWAQAGCTGWDWDSVLPYFKKAEDQQRGADDWHGTGGPLRVEDHPLPLPLADAFLDACEQTGYNRNPDFNGAEQEGAGYLQFTARKGRRESSATAYLKPARGRKNFKIRTNAHIKRVLIENRHAYGVEYLHKGRVLSVNARREVILCAGAYGSPQTLLLSGIGPAEHLKSFGITVVHDNPAVGSNLHDHFQTFASWRCLKGFSFNNIQNSFVTRMAVALKYGLFGSGPMSIIGLYAGLFTKSDPQLERADLQIILSAYSVATRTPAGVRAHAFPAFTLLPVHLRPDSRGTVRLQSPDPLAQPAISLSYLQTEYDRRAIREGVKICRQITSQGALRDYTGEELKPGIAVVDDEQLDANIRVNGTTNSHPSSTCAMGLQGRSVVDPRLRVYGITGLRVADTSIMPKVTGGNTNAPAIMIGEKAAAMILEDL